MKQGKFFYKYIGLSSDRSVRADFLGNRLFRFTQPDQLNDPFEVRPRVLLEQYSTEDIERAREQAIEAGFALDQLDQHLESPLKIIPGRMTVEEFPGLSYPKIPGTEERFRSLAEMDEYRAKARCDEVYQHINNTYGIFSLTTSRENLVMWSHYAESHKGIVVGFDATHPFFADSKDFWPVDYKEERISLSSYDGYLRLAGKDLPDESDYRDLAKVLFLRKHPDWKYEAEWRMIKRLDSATCTVPNHPSVYLYEIPVDAIKLVIMGAQIAPEDRNKIISLISASSIWCNLKILKATLSDSSFGLNFDEVKMGG